MNYYKWQHWWHSLPNILISLVMTSELVNCYLVFYFIMWKFQYSVIDNIQTISCCEYPSYMHCCKIPLILKPTKWNNIRNVDNKNSEVMVSFISKQLQYIWDLGFCYKLHYHPYLLLTNRKTSNNIYILMG